MAKDLHKEEFDEATKVKLSIFKDYLKEWLPVFISKREIYWDTINIFDFFAGPGCDPKGTKGTPLIIIDELQPYFDEIITKKLKVNLYFNEFQKTKCKQLEQRLLSNDDLRPYSIKIESLDFKDAFAGQFPNMSKKGCVNLLFLDQYGVKHIGEDIFKQIISLKQTDFLFFISSSTVKRFPEHSSIKQHINLNIADVEKTPYHKSHRMILDYYKGLIPQNKEYYLAPFSLKKNAGLYGIIFGTNHVLGIEKFLITCWGIDPERGEANFDIDEDKIIPGQADLFTGEVKKPKKVEIFEKELKEKVLKRQLKTDKDVYLFTITNGFLPKHTRKILASLVTDKKIEKNTLNIDSKVCRKDAITTNIKLC